MFQCGVPIENAEFKRTTVMEEQSNSPAPTLQRKRASQQQSLTTLYMPGTSKVGKAASCQSSEFEKNKTKQDPGSLQLTGSTSCFKSPLERYLENQEEKPRSSNCHRQERHNRPNCPYQCCKTFFHRGAISKHPEQKAQLQQLQKQQQEVLKNIKLVRNAM